MIILSTSYEFWLFRTIIPIYLIYCHTIKFAFISEINRLKSTVPMSAAVGGGTGGDDRDGRGGSGNSSNKRFNVDVSSSEDSDIEEVFIYLSLNLKKTFSYYEH